jgi:hypothetical protein
MAQLTIKDIDHEDVVTLSDGSRWLVAPGDARRIAAWEPGQVVTVGGAAFARQLTNKDSGSTVGATRK